MTTIAYKNGIMAADSRAYGFGAAPVGEKVKIYHVQGCLLGISTTVVGLSKKVREWAQAGFTDELKPPEPKDGFVNVLMVYPDGTAVIVDKNYMVSDKVKAKYYAVGSGSDYAMGAMEAGKSAREAVAIACKLDVWSSPPIRTIKH